MTRKTQPINENSWMEFYTYACRLEKEWLASLPMLTDKEILGIFPEAKAIIPAKIAEWEEKSNEISDTIKTKLELIGRRTPDKFSKWFWREWVKATDGIELLRAEYHIERLKHLRMVASGKVPRGNFTKEQIQQAKTVPIESLISQRLRKSGRALVGLCPFHKERSPSFYVYPQTNSCWCFGCQQGGDTITFIRLLHNYSFKEAVRYLIRE